MISGKYTKEAKLKHEISTAFINSAFQLTLEEEVLSVAVRVV